MSCCTQPLFLPILFQNISTTAYECSEYCYHHPEACHGHAVIGSSCYVCNHTLTTCTGTNTPLTTRPVPCHGNVCVAMHGTEIEVMHGTVVHISKNPNKYVGYSTEDVNNAQDGVYLRLNVSSPQNVTIIGPGVVLGDMPMQFGTNVVVKNSVKFRSCQARGVAQAALLLHEGGAISVEGSVESHYAKSFVVVAPKKALGETVTLSSTSSISYTGTDTRVCAAAFSHVSGTVNVKCPNAEGLCFSVTQDLDNGDNLQLHEDSDAIINVNLTSLLNDFGSEYLIQFVDGPANGDSVPTVVASILTSATLVLLLLTVIFHQRYFKF